MSDKNIEIWRPVKGYEGLYEVSNLGRVKSLERTVVYKNGTTHRHIGQILNPCYKRKYPSVSLFKNKKQKTYNVHRLVAEAFIPNPDNKKEIDHINTDRTDNRVENLRWCTSSENMNNPLTKTKNSNSHKDMWKKDSHREKICKKVLMILNGEVINTFYGTGEASRQTGINNSHIASVCRGKRKTAGGYKWKYIN